METVNYMPEINYMSSKSKSIQHIVGFVSTIFSLPGPKGHSVLLPYQCVVCRPSTLENKYSNIFFCKTTGPTVLKFHMEHELTLGSQNCKIRSG